MKVLAKLGLVTAAAATVLFIFIYEFQGPVINRVMSEPPVGPVQTESAKEQIPTASETENQTELLGQVELTQENPVEEIEEITEPVETESEPVVEPIDEEQPASVATEAPAGPTRHIYGKITLSGSGEQLSGVNIMIPGSAVAKVSNPNGGYTIEVPVDTRELVFIYRGKKLVQRVTPGTTLVNVALDLETMEWE